MPKTKLTDFDVTAANNSDINSISTLGTAPASNFDDAFRELMAQIAKAIAGTDAIKDTFALGDPSDLTKRVRLDAGRVTTGNTRVLTIPDQDMTLEPRFDRQFLSGLTISNNATDATNDIDIATGVAASDDNTAPLPLINLAVLTKRLDAAWAVGTGNGGLDTGTIGNSIYHVWLIKRSDTGVVDALFSLSSTSPTMPASYDLKRRVGAIIRATGAILPFIQYGDYFYRSVPVQTVNTTNPGTSAVVVVNQNIPNPPVSGQIRAIMSVQLTSSITATSYAGLVTATGQADTAPSTTLNNVVLRTGPSAGAYQSITNLEIPIDTSSQFRYRLSTSDVSVTISVITHGWVDTRGKGS
tara:strand:- start:4734 stop:5798 length:1065 start_codon:yes stop_codon:yes gene_type:complete